MAHFWGRAGSLQAYRKFAEVAGIEISDSARAHLKNVGIEAWSDIDEVPGDRQFGVIRMNWSLEHVHEPSRYFCFLRDHLQRNGRALIAVPNLDGLIYRIAADCVELPIHLFHFRPADIANYAGRWGLDIATMTTFSYPQMFVASRQAGLLPNALNFEPGLSAARAFQRVLNQFDAPLWGNDLLVTLHCRDG